MEKGLALIALVLALVALGITGVNALPHKTDEGHTPDPKHARKRLTQELTEIRKQLEVSEADLKRLQGRLEDWEENARGLVAVASGRHAGLTPEMQAAIDRIVQERLNRIASESTARAATTVRDLKEKDFEAMVADLGGHIGLKGKSYTRTTRNALVEARNTMRSNLDKYRNKPRERKQADDQERRRLDAKLKKVLTKTQYQRYRNWKKIQSEKGSRKTKYLFGL